MAIYVGETVMVTGTAHKPNGDPIVDMNGTVEFYGPGKNPVKVPGDRVVDSGPHALLYDPDLQAYKAEVSTAGFAPGKWTVRLRLSGGVVDTWEYTTFTLKP